MIRKTVLTLFILALPVSLFAEDQVRDLIVKIHAIRRSPDLLRPWSRLNPQHVYGSGVVIDGRRILTVAHVVQHAREIYVQPNQSPNRMAARVVAIAPPLDLALLELEDESFFTQRGALPVADELARVKDPVNVYGYPTGGTELSVTEGIVSRIEFAEYYYSAMGLRIQVDAALNPGNSGGPAVSNGKLVGLVFSLIPSAQSIGYLIPAEEIRLFLEDVRDGTYNGKAQLNETFQVIENSALRRKLGLPDGTSGIVVVEPYGGTADYPLKVWDVIASIGGQAVDSDGKVGIRYDLRLSALYLVQKYASGGAIRVTVFRDGKFIDVDVPVRPHREMVVPYLMNNGPQYFIYGPLVFSPATQDYLDRLGQQRELSLARQGSPLITRRYNRPEFEGEELVVVSSPMFPHRITKGYDDPATSVLKEVNGIEIKNLRHLVEILRDTRESQIVFKFARRGHRGPETLVFDREAIVAATERILDDNGIRYQHSDGIRELWRKRVK
jgi:S1-C subfamily serine protease